ncbi:MAG: hypothetical protein WC421_03595 [Elusimicrobiales bacterium]
MALAGETAAPVIDGEGYLAFSDGAPLSGYRADEDMITRYFKRAEPKLKEVEEAIGDGDDMLYSAALFYYRALQLQKNDSSLNVMSPSELANIRSYCDFGFEGIN